MTTNPYDELEGDDELPAPPRKDIVPADLELLTLAARALGAQFEEVDGEGYGNLHFEDGSIIYAWNSLVHSDDTFNLIVEIGVDVVITSGRTDAYCRGNRISEYHGDDKKAATRRAITRAAAEVGKTVA